MGVAFRVKIGLCSSISAGCIGAFVCLVRESLWDRFGAPPVSPAGGRQSVMRVVRRAEVRARFVDSVRSPAACALELLRCDSPAHRNHVRLSVPRVAVSAHSAGTHAEELYGANRGAVRARPTGVSGRARVHARFQRTRVRELRDISENRGVERGNWVHTWSLSEVSVTLPNLNRERKHQPSIVRSDAVSTIGATASWNGRLCASGRCVVARSHHPQS